ncbi:MAG TPA: hypothetical protein DEG71_05670 [Clostridiales bacterium]|nr:hypothetical protein [Clostridiales bacterium]
MKSIGLNISISSISVFKSFLSVVKKYLHFAWILFIFIYIYHFFFYYILFT